MYQQTVTRNADGTQTTTLFPCPAPNAILVWHDPTMQDIGHALRSPATSTAILSSPGRPIAATTNWDVYAERFNAAGQAQGKLLPGQLLGERPPTAA